jgi:uncharacterized protein (DUF885 family)
MMAIFTGLCASALLASAALVVRDPRILAAQDAAAPQEAAFEEPFYRAPDARSLAAEGGMRALIERWRVDRDALRRFFDVPGASASRARMRELSEAWLAEIARLDYDALPRGEQIDWQLLDGELRHELRSLELEGQRADEMAALLPFAAEIAGLEEARRRFEEREPEQVAGQLDALRKSIEALRGRVRSATEGSDGQADSVLASRVVAQRAAEAVGELRSSLGDWYGFRAGYDPLFSWWVARPWKALADELDGYRKHLREKVAGLEEGDDDTIVGDPIGREALLAELAHERIPYPPEQLIAIGDAELAWCRERMLETSRELGHGEDWKAALEHVKSLHAPPGGQPKLVRELALEALAFLDERDLLTVPDLARRTWRMRMMSAEAQKHNPFFLGGETISVSFPTEEMAHADKLMSLRANNIHFSRATVHHELIPGHHLQQFMQARYATHRRPFGTPFWTEGWALYWEMRLWELGFPKTPEDRVGMLFWRMHRCARIRFSLGFHLGELTPEQCVELLIDEVGHERASAEGEVRRSFQGGYSPLYQCAYMMGGLQILSLQRELVGAGRMSERDFHDAILRQGSIPIELVRAALDPALPLPRDARAEWLFYEPLRR